MSCIKSTLTTRFLSKFFSFMRLPLSERFPLYVQSMRPFHQKPLVDGLTWCLAVLSSTTPLIVARASAYCLGSTYSLQLLSRHLLRPLF